MEKSYKLWRDDFDFSWFRQTILINLPEIIKSFKSSKSYSLSYLSSLADTSAFYYKLFNLFPITRHKRIPKQMLLSNLLMPKFRHKRKKFRRKLFLLQSLDQFIEFQNIDLSRQFIVGVQTDQAEIGVIMFKKQAALLWSVWGWWVRGML